MTVVTTGSPWAPGLELDSFQHEALASIDAGRNVLVSAPTGAGKTVVAYHAVGRALERGRKAVYTTPVKALSNQKYQDLVARHGPERVGLLTGDRRINPTAPVVVMTTEVLRALLYERAEVLDDLDVVVLDEAHFITDPERGPVWEEVVIHAPASVRVVALSATLDEAHLLAAWLEERRGPTDLVICEDRPVPLRHLYGIGRLDGTEPMLLPVEVEGEPNPTALAMDGTRVKERGEGLRRRYRSRTRAVTPTRRDLMTLLVKQEMVPAIWFVLSRSGCESAARRLLEDGPGFTTPQESIELRRRAERVGGGFGAPDLRVLDFGGWAARFAAGVTTHHGGLLPVQRELVEAAFADGLMKVVFATETLALGVNLPARTVVVDRVTRGEEGGGVMAGSTFAQLAGRAGRRGLDHSGVAIVPWSEEVSFLQVAALVGGRPQPLRSWFRPTPVMAANLVRRASPSPSDVMDASLAAFLRRRQVSDMRPEAGRLRSELESLLDHSCDQCDGSSTREHGGEVRTTDGVEDLRPGDVVIDPSRVGAPPAVVVGPPRVRRGLATVDLVRGDGRRMAATARDFRVPPVVLARVDLAKWTSTERGHARAAADALAQLNLDAATAQARKATTITRHRAVSAPCPAGRADRVRRALEDVESRIERLEDGDQFEFAATVALLEDLGHLRDGCLTVKGQLMRRLFVPAGPVLAECLDGGGFRELSAPDLAAATSFFTPCSSSRERAAAEGHPNPTLARIWGRAVDASAQIERLASKNDLDPPAGPDRSIAPALHRWCVSGSIAEALSAGEVTPGDLAREARQVAELLDQMCRADPELTTTAETAQALLLQGALADAS
ncbi:MAG TPA: DEAD/DEAH box helicase [Acidimicrobiales bacterium]|nr:DEAD/DEAH box helicase [Acidimicrobiales bacterium]